MMLSTYNPGDEDMPVSEVLIVTRLNKVLENVTCGEYSCVTGPMGEGAYLQVVWVDPTNTEQKGRKWYISQHMGENEVVQTALRAVLDFIEHEIRETFMWNDKAIFAPHYNLKALESIADRQSHRS